VAISCAPPKQGKDRSGGFKDMVSIHEHYEHVLSRELFGHWAGDLIKGAGNASAIGTIVERKSRFTILANIANCSAEAALKGFGSSPNRAPQFKHQTMINDQGTEIAQHKELAKILIISVCFCDPHRPWQRPTKKIPTTSSANIYPKALI
jgi:transposase, IS30 family